MELREEAGKPEDDARYRTTKSITGKAKGSIVKGKKKTFPKRVKKLLRDRVATVETGGTIERLAKI